MWHVDIVTRFADCSLMHIQLSSLFTRFHKNAYRTILPVESFIESEYPEVIQMHSRLPQEVCTYLGQQHSKPCGPNTAAAGCDNLFIEY